MDANGLVVYDGEFVVASYVKETFNDRAELQMGGVGLAAAGAVIALPMAGQSGTERGANANARRGQLGAAFRF